MEEREGTGIRARTRTRTKVKEAVVKRHEHIFVILKYMLISEFEIDSRSIELESRIDSFFDDSDSELSFRVSVWNVFAGSDLFAINNAETTRQLAMFLAEESFRILPSMHPIFSSGAKKIRMLKDLEGAFSDLSFNGKTFFYSDKRAA